TGLRTATCASSGLSSRSSCSSPLRPVRSTVPSPMRSTWTRALSKMYNRYRSRWKNRRSRALFASGMMQLTCIGIVLMLLSGSSLGIAGEQPHVFHGIISQSPPHAADFTLTAHTGKPVHLSDFQGKLVLLYFGYTFCPGICPTTLAEVAQALQTLGPQEAEQIQVLMISVDPERDTAHRLAEYLTYFNPTFL